MQPSAVICMLAGQLRAQRQYLVFMSIKGIDALTAAHTPQLQQSVGTAGHYLQAKSTPQSQAWKILNISAQTPMSVVVMVVTAAADHVIHQRTIHVHMTAEGADGIHRSATCSSMQELL